MRGILPLPSNYATWYAWAAQLVRVLNEDLPLTHTALTLTLRPGETTTTILNAAISGNTVALLMPVTASAAGAVVHQVASRGEIVFTHDADPAIDRTFRVVVL